jgi:hypothetical protein
MVTSKDLAIIVLLLENKQQNGTPKELLTENYPCPHNL